MMNAGSVTIAIAITNVMYQLLKKPRCLKKLCKEIDAALDPEEVIAPYNKVKHLPYLRACLDESLRLFPPTSHGLPRETPPEGLYILDDYVLGGVSVSVSAVAVDTPVGARVYASDDELRVVRRQDGRLERGEHMVFADDSAPGLDEGPAQGLRCIFLGNVADGVDNREVI